MARLEPVLCPRTSLVLAQRAEFDRHVLDPPPTTCNPRLNADAKPGSTGTSAAP